MTDRESETQQRDALLLKLLKTPPQQRPKRERGGKPSPKRDKESSPQNAKGKQQRPRAAE
jgi:hypothetical protein